MFGRTPSKAVTIPRLILSITLCASAAAPAVAQVTAPPAPATKAKAAGKSKATTPPAAPLDLNKATAEEMQESLPGVGGVTARKIVAGRPYASIDDLAKAGVPTRTIEQIRPLVTATTPRAEEPKARAKAAGAGAATKTARIDLNAAHAEELETLPGVGPAFAREIIAARPLKSVDDLEALKGFGKARVDALRDLVTVSAARPPAPTTTAPAAKSRVPSPPRTVAAKTTSVPARPVNINTASPDELDALPGIGPVKAQAILEYRKGQPFKAKEDVMKVKGIKEGEFAKIKDLITVN